MSYLLDTNILLRFLLRNDPAYAKIREAVSLLKMRREQLFITAQNITEFWNVCTRPVTARGGLGLGVEATEHRVRLLERNFHLLPDTPAIYSQWKTIVTAHSVSGVEVHDARLVAAMNAHRITHLLTLNVKDFSRYQDIKVVAPEDIK